MVAVEDHHPSQQAKNRIQQTGVPQGARPAGAFAVKQESAQGGMPSDNIPEPGHEDDESLFEDASDPPSEWAHAIFRSFSVRLMRKLAMAYFSSVVLHASDETYVPAVADPHSIDEEALGFPRPMGSDVWQPAPVRAAAGAGSAASAEGLDCESVSTKASVASTTADARVLQLQHELQMARMKASLDLQATRFEDALRRQELQSKLDMQQAIAQAQLEAQAKIFASQQSADAQVRAQQQAADLAGMQALAERLDKPREQRPIKDIYSDSLVKCPLDKSKDEVTEWAMALAAAASGLCEPASEMIMMVMARDTSVLAFAAEPENVQADRWLARQINTSIKEDTEAGKLFHKEARQDAYICRSGVRLLDKVYKTVTKTNPLKLDQAEHKMASTIYFKGGMTLDQTKLGAEQFKTDYTELGSRRSQSELAMYTAMLKELPPALHEPQSTIMRDLLWEMEEATMNSELLITFEKLVTKMAVMLRNVQGAAKKNKEVNAALLTYAGAAKGKGKGKGAAKGGAPAKGKGGKGAPGKGSGGKGTSGIACAVCGKANVLTSACTCPPCVRCKFRFCPGAPGARAITGLGCVFDMPKFPEHKLVVQANGPIPRSLYVKAAKEYATWWGVPYEASETEASATELDEGALRLAEEKGSALEGSVCEMEISSTERGIHTIVRGHPQLLALRAVMYLDASSNTPMLPGCETIHLDDGANVMLISTKGLLKAAHARSWASNGAIASVAKGAKLSLEGEASLTMYPLCAGGAHELVQLHGHKASGARRNIVPRSSSPSPSARRSTTTRRSTARRHTTSRSRRARSGSSSSTTTCSSPSSR